MDGRGFAVWRDRTGLLGGDRFDDEIQNALETAHAVLGLMSPASVASRWASSEREFALGRKTRLIPVRLADYDKPVNLVLLNELKWGDAARYWSRLPPHWGSGCFVYAPSTLADQAAEVRSALSHRACVAVSTPAQARFAIFLAEQSVPADLLQQATGANVPTIIWSEQKLAQEYGQVAEVVEGPLHLLKELADRWAQYPEERRRPAPATGRRVFLMFPKALMPADRRDPLTN